MNLLTDDIEDIAQVRQLLRAHEYWRMKGLSVDLVIVNERASSYVQDLQTAIEMLSEVKESLINAYEQRTGLPRSKISSMMDAETWFSAQKAVELGFADKILYAPDAQDAAEGFIFDRLTVTNAFLRKLPREKEKLPAALAGTPHKELLTRLELLK